MDWDKEAVEIVEAIPLPPMIAHFAKMDAERRAKKKGEKRVTAETARETEHGYEQALGRESVELMRRMARGEDAGLPDEFFVEEPDELYSIELCPAKYGASTMEKREQMRRLLTPLRNKLKELGITQIIMDKAQTSIMSPSHAADRPHWLPQCLLFPLFPGFCNTGCLPCRDKGHGLCSVRKMRYLLLGTGNQPEREGAGY